MDPQQLHNRLSEQLVSFAWEEWSQMGVLATPRRRSPWAQDPEALIVFTLEVARADPRLFDELLDWMLTNEPLLSVRRLRAMCVDGTDEALSTAAVGWLARHRPRARLKNPSSLAQPSPPEPLFPGQPPVREPDADFAAAGFLRGALIPSRNSRPPNPVAPINLAFRLRQILGVGIRSEVVRVLITTDAPWANAAALAESTGYTKRNVHDALAGLSNAQVIETFAVNGENRYKADRDRWAAMLRCTPTELPSHRDWSQLLGALRQILRFSGHAELEGLSGYMRGSRARDELEQVRPTLAFAGIASSFSTTPDGGWDDLEHTIDRALAAIDPGPRDLPFASIGRSGHESTARDMEALLQ